MKPILTCLTALLLCNDPAPAADAGHPLPMWRVEGVQNSLFLLGSIHMLRKADHPIPAGIYDAYDEAEVLIMELDMDDVDPIREQSLVTELGLIQDGRDLRDLMGNRLYTRAESIAKNLQIPLALLEQSEPWYAAITVELMMLMRAGFDPTQGIEARLSEHAGRDRKEIHGLETARQQLELLDGLSQRSQRDMLMQALEEGTKIEQLMDGLVAAWRRGDIAFLEENLLADMQDHPELHRVIVVNRNRDWVEQLEPLLDDEDDYLVVVGALHLVGDDGVPELLAARGHAVRQMRQAAGQ